MKPYQRIHEATENNDHNQALKYGLESLPLEEKEREEYLFKLEKITKEHERIGYMTPENILDRNEIYYFMQKRAKQLLTPTEYSLFYSAF